jgi:hypothetical protein
MYFDLQKKTDGTVVFQRQTTWACYATSAMASPGEFLFYPPGFSEA